MKKLLTLFTLFVVIISSCSTYQETKKNEVAKSTITFEDISFSIPTTVSKSKDENANQNLFVTVKSTTIAELNKNKNKQSNKLAVLYLEKGKITKEAILDLYKSDEIFIFHNLFPMGGTQRKQYQVVKLT